MARLFLLLLAAAHLGGCALVMYSDDGVYARVEAKAAPSFNRSLPHAVVASDAAQAADPQFPELAEQTRRMLSAAGLAVAPANARLEAAVLVTTRFEMGEWIPDVYTDYEAVYAETGVESSKSVEHVNERGERVTVTTYTPRREFAGLQPIERPSTRRDITLVLTARPREPRAGSPKELWSVKVVSRNWFLHYPATAAQLLRAAQLRVGLTGSIPKAKVQNDDAGADFIRTGRRLPKG